MQPLPHVHLCIVQPKGDVHPLGFIDPARYFRWQFRRLGAQVTIGKNRLRHDAVNFVFGSHLGFDPALRQRYATILVQLEQLGLGGRPVPEQYLQLLRSSAVVDYDAGNVAAYAADPPAVPIAPFLHAPYLAPAPGGIPIERRPIDLLFFGSMNERRRRIIQRIESTGLSVSQFDHPLFGPERDTFIRQAKAVLNCHFYETTRFEQARASQCLSLGTPLISERAPSTRPHPAFEDAVFWFDDASIESFFSRTFATPGFADAARRKLAAFAHSDSRETYADLLRLAAEFHQRHRGERDPAPWRPARINLGSGKDYMPGWLNIDVQANAQPDLLLDLATAPALPIRARGDLAGDVLLEASSAECIYANNVLEHVPDLPAMMSRCLGLLKTGGTLIAEVPHERARTAWQDPTHVRAFNENSWIYYTEWFWYLGWFEHRFEIAKLEYLDGRVRPCAAASAEFMRVYLRKIETTPRERMTARMQRADFCLDDDQVEASPVALAAA